MYKGQELVNTASQHLGTRAPAAKEYCGLSANANYCDAFVTWLFYMLSVKALYCNGTKQVYCPTSIKWCYKNLAALPPYMALPGDVIFFDWEPNGDPNHVGLVRKKNSAVDILTIEGNTSKTNSKGQVIAAGVVAKKVRTLYGTKNGKTVQYIQGIFRPHYAVSFDSTKPLVIDGDFGPNSVAMLQIALGMKATGIFTRETLIALQKKAGTTADGDWGEKTSIAVQEMLKKAGIYTGKIDGLFGPASVKALQKWINSKVSTKTIETAKTEKKVATAAAAAKTTTTKTKAQKAEAYGRKMIKKGFGYITYEKQKKCGVCGKNAKYKSNCIGTVGAMLRHGAGIKVKCSASGLLNNSMATKMLATTKAKALKMWQARNGKKWSCIKNSKGIASSKLKPMDVVIYYKGKTYQHTAMYIGNGKIIDNRSSGGMKVRSYKISGLTCKMAFRYTGK